MNLQIRITGSGTREQIVKALNDLITCMREADEEDFSNPDAATWEDPILFSEVWEAIIDSDDEGPDDIR
jgi:hypothetical protein